MIPGNVCGYLMRYLMGYRSPYIHFSKERERRHCTGVFSATLAQAQKGQFLSDEHFTVDGTLIEAWPGQRSFRRKGEKPMPVSL